MATIGAFHIVRRRRTWPEPSAMVCPTCGQDFWNGDVRPWAIRAFGPVRYCMDCCCRVPNGDPRATWFEKEVKDALHELRDAFGAIPAQSFPAGRVPHDGTPEGHCCIKRLRDHEPVNSPAARALRGRRMGFRRRERRSGLHRA